MPTCLAAGWGTGVWGSDPWAAPIGGGPGGPIPNYLPNYDIYCVGPCGQMLYFTSYDEVQEFSVSGQFVADLVTEDLVIKSDSTTLVGPVISTALIWVDVGVPDDWTLEYTFLIESMPVGFTSIEDEHIFVGTADGAGSCAGLFFSASGIAYTGSVWYDPAGKAHINSAFQVIPSSAGLVNLGEYYTVRMAVDDGNGVTYIYITRTADLPVTGHVLRFVLPAIKTSSSIKFVNDGTYISCCGSWATPVQFRLDSICLGTGLVIPNLPPQADAGRDQSARMCNIVRLDGRASFDPEGAPLTYRWRLVDAPVVSSFILESTDGFTLPPPPLVYTNRLYSEELGDYDSGTDTEVAIGDVIVVDGVAYNITSTGTDGFGFYVVIDSYALDVGTSSIPFKMLKQNGISNPTGAQPSFYPDVTGIFKFDLIVFDGSLYSLPSLTVLNVVESVVPRGCIPDLSFLWNYVSDFWGLVENKEHIATFWGALAQIAATELLGLWQVEYNKSLRDIQRTFQRRWLHYDLRIIDPRKEDSTIRFIYSGIYLQEVPLVGLDLAGKTVVVEAASLGEPVEVMFTGAGLLPEATILSQLTLKLEVFSKDFSVTKLYNSVSGRSQIRMSAPFPFTISDTSTAVDLLPVLLPANNAEPEGAGGTVAGIDSFLVDRDLSGLDIKENDLLVLGSEAYRILRVVSKGSTDDWEYQRLVVKDPLPLSPSATWHIVGGITSAFLDFYHALLAEGDVAYFEVTHNESGSHVDLTASVYGAAIGAVDKLAVNLWSLADYIHDPNTYTVNLTGVHRRTYMPVSALVTSVPILQERIKNSPDEEILRENVDFFLGTYRDATCLQFMTGTPDVWQGDTPPDRMWAEVSYIDNRPVIESNFGIPAEFTLDDLAQLTSNVDYLSAVRGIWYSYFYGPTLRNLRVGTQILLGLPFAEEEGVIEEIRSDFSSKQGRILVRDTNDQEVVRFYTYPRILTVEVNPATGEVYKVGDTVSQFAPLIEGVEVVDHVKDPDWFAGYLSQGNFYEVEKFHRFLVRVNSSAFNLSALLFVKSFINKIKPTYTFPKFVVRYNVSEGGDAVDVTDVVEIGGTLRLHDDISYRGLGHWMHVDDPRAAGGGWRGRLDDGWAFTPHTVYPTPTQPVVWAVDKSELVPEDSIFCVYSVVMDGFVLPALDTGWRVDVPVIVNYQFTWDSASIDHIPAVGEPGEPIQIGEVQTASANYAATGYQLEILAMGPNSEAVDLEIYCAVNGVVDANSVTLTTMPVGGVNYLVSLVPAGWSWLMGDTLTFFVRSPSTSFSLAGWYKVIITVGDEYLWALDTAPPAGTYTVPRLM